jgi:pimeloyl-ACP methyl ester carboxylesterase
MTDQPVTSPAAPPTTPDRTDGAIVTGTAHRPGQDREVEIAYETVGPSTGAPLVLIAGTGAQRYLWDERFCAALVEHGFQVTRFDNRDTGASTRFDDAGRPNQLAMMLGRAAGPYTLEDMAGDVIAVLDDQGWDSAHLVGASMGGMLAQVTACTHPDRVRSITSISATPAPRIGQPSIRDTLRLAKIARPAVTDPESLARQWIGIAQIVGSPDYPTDTARLNRLGQQCFERRNDLAACQRHTAAIVASGDRRATLATLRVPTLVVHGEADRMVRPAAGRATAEAIPGAELRTFPGMGHDLPQELWGQITAAIAANAGLSTTA